MPASSALAQPPHSISRRHQPTWLPPKDTHLEETRMHLCITRWGWPAALGLLLLSSTSIHAAVGVPGGSIDKVDFERHIMGLLGRMGCASGSCHGSFQGKGGLQLSLFGYDPARDFD